jgi:hypothetical protein
MTEAEILQGLAGISEENRMWVGVLAVVKLVEEEEMGFALMPGSTDEARHYNAGRAAGVVDLRKRLVGLWRKANPGLKN